jgi:hypothetical protein
MRFTTHFKNMRSFYYPLQKHAFVLPPISKTRVIFTTHFKSVRSFCAALYKAKYVSSLKGYNTAVLQPPTVFSTVTCCTGL